MKRSAPLPISADAAWKVAATAFDAAGIRTLEDRASAWTRYCRALSASARANLRTLSRSAATEAYGKAFRDVKKATRGKLLGQVKAVFAALVAADLLAFNPLDGVKAPKAETPVVEVPSRAQCEVMRSRCTTDLQRRLFCVLYDCGLRIDEALSLRWSDLPREANGFKLIVREGKGGKGREGLLAEAPAVVARLAAPDDADPEAFVFPHPGSPTSPLNYEQAERRMAPVFGLDSRKRRITFHKFRYACGEGLHEAGADLNTIKGILGHASITTTARYVKPQAAKMAAAMGAKG